MDDNSNDWKMLQSAWKAIEDAVTAYEKKHYHVKLHQEKKEEFKQTYQAKYKDVMDRFMVDDTSALDSHKQAALLTISCLESNIVEHKLQDPKKISIIPQMIAIDIGLSYMLQELNDLLRNKNIDKKIERYYLPLAIACDTPYQEIMCRILYHQQKEEDMSLNVLELADRYFLIEYINLLQYGIEPYELRSK